MIYSVNYMDLTEKINPFNFAKYLIDTGWSIYPTKRKKIKIFQLKKDTGKRYQVTIPLDKIFSDYKYVKLKQAVLHLFDRTDFNIFS